MEDLIVVQDGPDGATSRRLSELDDEQLRAWAELGVPEAQALLEQRSANHKR